MPVPLKYNSLILEQRIKHLQSRLATLKAITKIIQVPRRLLDIGIYTNTSESHSIVHDEIYSTGFC